MTDPYADPEPEASRRPNGCLVVLLGIVAGVALVGGGLVAKTLLTHDHKAGTAGLERVLVSPAGYVVLEDGGTGAGTITPGGVGHELFGAGDSDAALRGPDFEGGLARAWGRPPEDSGPPRAVVIDAVAFRDPDLAMTVAADVRNRLRTRQRSGFAVPGIPEAAGILAGPDDAQRYVQRVVFARDGDVFVVSLFTPVPETDTAEVRRLARQQYDAV